MTGSMSDEVTLSISGEGFTNLVTGWTEVRITRGIERMPSDFEISMTDPLPDANQIAVTEGSPCQIKIGEDVVITGYIDRVIPGIGPEEHGIKVIGRGKCQDLVDCAAVWPSGQFMNYTVLGIAEALAQPFGINVILQEGVSAGAPIPQTQVSPGETPFDVISQQCRLRHLLCYEDENGDLILGQAGSSGAAGGLQQGVNIENASLAMSADKRFSHYSVIQQGTTMFQDIGNLPLAVFTLKDPLVKRFRPKYITVENGDAGNAVAIARARWEMNRRIGRSNMLNVHTDNWRDADGNIWYPNTLSPLDIPKLKISQLSWLIGEITYSYGSQGKRCDMVIMPPQAFMPEPILLHPLMAEMAPALK